MTEINAAMDELELTLEDLSENLPAENLPGMGQVEVTTDRAVGRERQISAKICIPHPVEQVWQILTDYNRLADFIPNLAESRQIEHPQGGIRIEQIGTQALMRLKFCARVVLDMVEQFPHQIDFQMVEGDFKTFCGYWALQPTESGASTELCYTVAILPARAMPIGLIERKLKTNLATNMIAIRQRADEIFGAGCS